MEKEENFYSNEEVICIESHSSGCVIKGNKYIINSTLISCCGIRCVTIKNILNPNLGVSTEEECVYGCGNVRSVTRYWELRASRFTKVKRDSTKNEEEFKKVTFKELEKEINYSTN